MIENVYGDQCMSRAHCHEWFKRFKDGRQSTHDEPRLGRPPKSCDDAHVAQVREIVRSKLRLKVREIAEECNISIGSCHDGRDILTTKLEMQRVVSKFVLQLLTQDQRETVALSSFRNFWIALARMKTFRKEL
jgi:hypothetical protein